MKIEKKWDDSRLQKALKKKSSFFEQRLGESDLIWF